MQNVIFDGDGGGDEMQLAAVLLAAKNINVLGATTVFGNTDLNQVVQNTGKILHFLKADSIPYFIGAKGPTGAKLLEGDGAHGDDGIGGVKLEPAIRAPETQSAVDFILETLRKNPPKTVKITATGPLTNIAQAYQQDPRTMRRVQEIVIMGGCTKPIPAHDMQFRQGNITPFAEFNFYMAAKDAACVMNSGLPITLFPMNCTQQMSVTRERQDAIRLALFDCGDVAEKVLGMMCAPAQLDRDKFNSDPFMHDVHTALYLLRPYWYQGDWKTVNVETSGENMGQTDAYMTADNPVYVHDEIIAPHALFSDFLSSLKSRLASTSPAPASEPEPVL